LTMLPLRGCGERAGERGAPKTPKTRLASVPRHVKRDFLVRLDVEGKARVGIGFETFRCRSGFFTIVHVVFSPRSHGVLMNATARKVPRATGIDFAATRA
jgi:hypothetical protein